jgi:hypothetical protein
MAGIIVDTSPVLAPGEQPLPEITRRPLLFMSFQQLPFLPVAPLEVLGQVGVAPPTRYTPAVSSTTESFRQLLPP